MVLIIDFLSACATIYHIFISDANIGKCNGGSKALPAIFLKIEKNFRNFKKKYPDCVDLWVKYFIRNAVLRASRREKIQNIPLGAFKLVCWCCRQNVCHSTLIPRNLVCPGKSLVALLHLYIPYETTSKMFPYILHLNKTVHRSVFMTLSNI